MYEKQTWADGQVITAEKLNHIEDGLCMFGVTVVTIEVNGWDDVQSDISGEEIVHLLEADYIVFANVKGVDEFGQTNWSEMAPIAYELVDDDADYVSVRLVTVADAKLTCTGGYNWVNN